jgi:hypothetical protein
LGLATASGYSIYSYELRYKKMTGKIRTLALAEGLSFGRDGRYAVLEVLGRGWEGEVYAVADTTIEGAPNGKVAKFTSVISDDFSVAPSWGRKDIQTKKKDPFKSNIPQDLLWYEFSGKQKEWIEAIEDVRKNANLAKKAAVKVLVPLLPRIEDYGCNTKKLHRLSSQRQILDCVVIKHIFHYPQSFPTSIFQLTSQD